MSPAGKPSRSASAIVADTASGYHILKIESYSRTKGLPTGERLVSRPFTVGGHRWCIRYFPNGDTSEYADYISLFLALDESATEAVRAQHQFRFLDDGAEQVAAPSLTSAKVNTFHDSYGWGRSRFINRTKFEASNHLRDDSFTVRCDIVVIKDFRTEDTAHPPTRKTFVSVPPSNLHQHLGDLLLTKKGSDVIFDVGGETFTAHRCVLAARSQVFNAELYGAMKESDTMGVVRIDDMEAQVFKALLYFMYTDSLPEMKKEDEEDVMSQHLLVAADKYNIERLKLICEDKLCKYIDVGTVATILALADQHHCQGLKKACFDFLSSQANLRAVMAGDGFKHLSRSCPTIMEELIAMLAT